MAHYLYRIQPTRVGMLTDGPTQREAQVVQEHFAYLERLVAAGTVLMAGRTTNADERTFGIVVFVADSEKHVMRAELFPYRIALWSRGPVDA